MGKKTKAQPHGLRAPTQTVSHAAGGQIQNEGGEYAERRTVTGPTSPVTHHVITIEALSCEEAEKLDPWLSRGWVVCARYELPGGPHHLRRMEFKLRKAKGETK